MLHTVQAIQSPEPISDSRGIVTAFGVTLSESMMQKLLGIGERLAGFLPALFGCTMLWHRRASTNPQAIALSQRAGRDVIYCYWVDDYTEAQLKIKEQKAQQWISAGKPSKITREEAETVWGKRTANAVFQRFYRKRRKTVTKEKMLIRAYDAIINRTGQTIVTKQEILAELVRRIPRRLKGQPTQAQATAKKWEWYSQHQAQIDREWRGEEKTREEIAAEVRQKYQEEYKTRCRTWPRDTWERGKAELFKQRGLEYRALRKAEKEIYGDTGRQWVLIPSVNEWQAMQDIGYHAVPVEHTEQGDEPF